MSQDWLQYCAQAYLTRLMHAEVPPGPNPLCADCGKTNATFQCRDCLNSAMLCSECILSRHSYIPTHRAREWNGKYFAARTWTSLGYVFHLGHGGKPCNLGKTVPFTLGDTTGIREINIRFCRHPGHVDFPKQLLDAKIFPCSDKRPRSGFTFAVLRKFHFLSNEAKLSVQRYYNVLVHLTSTAFPDSVPDRYREFMRVSRQWDHLQDIKRAGIRDVIFSSPYEGDLALRCPVCPRLGINYLSSDVDALNRYVFYLEASI